jgi:hypothetical protein
MIYSHYSEFMAKSMSAGRPGPAPEEWAHLLKYLQANEEPFWSLRVDTVACCCGSWKKDTGL